MSDNPRKIHCRIVAWTRDSQGNKTVWDIKEGHFGERTLLRWVKGGDICRFVLCHY